MAQRAADDFETIGRRLRELEHGKIEPIVPGPVSLQDLTEQAVGWLRGAWAMPAARVLEGVGDGGAASLQPASFAGLTVERWPDGTWVLKPCP